MTLITVYLVKSLFKLDSPAFEFNLYQRQPIDEQGNIVAILVSAFGSDLVSNLKLILTPVFLFYKFEVETFSIIPDNMLLIP